MQETANVETNNETTQKVTIRCANALYMDDDCCVQNVSVYAKEMDEDEITNALSEIGMIGIEIRNFYDVKISIKEFETLKLGDVVEVFEVSKEDEINFKEWYEWRNSE